MIQYIISCIIVSLGIYISYNFFYNKKYARNIDKPITLIGIMGRKQSGKDTVGKYFVEKYGFKRLAYADTLKEVCKIIFGLTDEQVYGNEKKEIKDKYWNHTPREILQKVGTELFRDTLSKELEHIDKDIWVRSIEKTILNDIKKGFNKFVITDVRFQNELDFINNNNGITIKVVRPSIIKYIDHISESFTDIMNADITLINDSNIANLYRSVDNSIKLCDKLCL